MTYLKMSLRNLLRRRWRTFFTVIAIGTAVSMMILLTSISLGLNQNTVNDNTIDYWVLPAGSIVTDPITGAGQTMLENVHSEIETLFLERNVQGASPVLNSVIYSRSNTDDEVNVVIARGVIPGTIDVIPASVSGLTQGDPYFYGGNRTKEAVINRQLADLSGLNIGDLLYINISVDALIDSEPFTIVNIFDKIEYSGYPLVVVHLSELQQLSGNLENDQADHIIIKGENAGELLERLYPDHLILSGSQYTTHKIMSDQRILATAFTASLVSFIMGVLFIGTTMIMSVSEREGEMAVMSAIGISRSSIVRTVLYESLFLSLAGGITGIIFTFIGKMLLLSFVLKVFGFSVQSITDPILLLGGLGIALVSGIFTSLLAALLMKRPDISRVF